MAITTLVHGSLHNAVTQYLAPDPPSELRLTKMVISKMTTKVTPQVTDTHPPGATDIATFTNLTGLDIFSASNTTTLNFNEDFNQAIAQADLISLYYTPQGGSEFLAITITESIANMWIIENKPSSVPIEFTVLIVFANHQIQTATFNLTSPSEATEQEMINGTLGDVYASPRRTKGEIDRRVFPTTSITITGGNNAISNNLPDYNIDNYTIPGIYNLTHGGGTNWQGEPTDFSETGDIRLVVDNIGGSSLDVSQIITEVGSDILPRYRRSYTDGQSPAGIKFGRWSALVSPHFFVSTSDPTSDDGEDGDFWFKYST